MSTGDKKDWNEFNCDEDHEFTYVKNLYFDPSGVKDWLTEACNEGKISHSLHKDIYTMLENAGFVKK